MSYQSSEKNELVNEIEEIHEVAITTSDYVFAVSIQNVLPTRALEAYKRRVKVGLIKPFQLCPNYHVALGGSGSCPRRRRCNGIHLVEKAVRFKCPQRLRTPCCWQHGDSLCPRPSGTVISVRGPGKVWRFRSGILALTSHRCDSDTPLAFKDICIHHLGCNCKFGRDCEKLHVCRVWAKKVGLTEALLAWEAGGGSQSETPQARSQEDTGSAENMSSSDAGVFVPYSLLTGPNGCGMSASDDDSEVSVDDMPQLLDEVPAVTVPVQFVSPFQGYSHVGIVRPCIAQPVWNPIKLIPVNPTFGLLQ